MQFKNEFNQVSMKITRIKRSEDQFHVTCLEDIPTDYDYHTITNGEVCTPEDLWDVIDENYSGDAWVEVYREVGHDPNSMTINNSAW
jgi:hypothetical protein